ncbi:hypothetical protein D3C75_902990 [compost metagenome]
MLDTVFGQKAMYILLLVIGIGLDLVHSRDNGTLCKHILQMFTFKIGDADGPNLPFLVEPLQGKPAFQVVNGRPMDQIKIDIIRLQPAETAFKGLLGPFAQIRAPHLRGQENVGSFDPRLLNSTANQFFIVIKRCRINMAVPIL